MQRLVGCGICGVFGVPDLAPARWPLAAPHPRHMQGCPAAEWSWILQEQPLGADALSDLMSNAEAVTE